MDSVRDAKSVADFSQFAKDAGSSLVVAQFWADWAPQCQQMIDVMQELAKDPQLAGVVFVKVEAEKVPEVSQKYEIAAVPTCVLIQNASVLDRVNGANAPELANKVRKYATATMGTAKSKPVEGKSDKEALNDRLKKLINAAPVMLFMKGTPDEPKCGFSRTITQILNEQKIRYSTFNILADQDVRQGLKEYSDWPTFPQLYSDGELVGGLDIVKEMVESGELETLLPKKASLDDRLRALISKERVMLFMKGSPEAPRCGFSKTIIGLLQDAGAPFGHFDILSDEEVRQGLKAFSDWPTYPQLYVKGELIGGLDIIKEMKESGELESALKGDQ